MRVLEVINLFKDAYNHQMKEVAEKYHLRQTELDILLFLSENDENNTITKISVNFHILKSLVCMTIQSLQIKGLVTLNKNENNKKIFFVRPTLKAKPIIEEAEEVENNIKDIIFSGFSEFEKKKIRDRLEHITNNINEYNAEDDK